MRRNKRCTRAPSSYYGSNAKIQCVDFVPPPQLNVPVEFGEEMKFLILDVTGTDTGFTHWISPNTTDRTILELYTFLYLLNRIFAHADLPCCMFVQQKQRLVPGDLNVRKEIVTEHLLYWGFHEPTLQDHFSTFLTVAAMINACRFDVESLFVSNLSVASLCNKTAAYDPVKGLPVGENGAKNLSASTTIGSYTTLDEFAKLLRGYHRLSSACRKDLEDGDDDDDQEEVEEEDQRSRSRYEELSRQIADCLSTDDPEEFGKHALLLLSPTFLFQRSFRTANVYREIKDLLSVSAEELGLSADQARTVASSGQQEFIRIVSLALESPHADTRSAELLRCARRAVRRLNWTAIFRSWRSEERECCLDLTDGISWRVPSDH